MKRGLLSRDALQETSPFPLNEALLFPDDVFPVFESHLKNDSNLMNLSLFFSFLFFFHFFFFPSSSSAKPQRWL